ncbi:MAG: T9SS type A sorting domain-containing protein [Ignavibacteria bacterium]|nr:T9SS type A sorting domain-containing protein [Ignavibacteria bacterium]
MIKILTFIFLTLQFPAALLSGDGWIQQYSNSTERLENVFFLNENTGWIVGSGGTFMKTENAGLSWESFNFSAPHILGSVFFLNESTGWISGGYDYISIVFKTTDGGKNWQVQLFDVSAFYASSLHFFNENSGWLINCGNKDGWRIMKTTDGGNVWTNVYVGHYLSCLHFLNEQTAWAVGCNSGASQGAVLKTTDGGITWIDTFVPETIQFQSVCFVNENTGWAVGIDGAIVKSTNGGLTWFAQESTSSLTAVEFADENTGWVAGFAGILKTTNGGKNWGYQNVDQLIWGIHFENKNTGWAAGHDGLIYKTTDGGGSFENIPKKFTLFQNYPNPFNPKTTIKFSISNPENVRLRVFDITGKFVAELVDKFYTIGTYEIDFDATGLSSGIYFYRIEMSDFSDSKKMILVK